MRAIRARAGRLSVSRDLDRGQGLTDRAWLLATALLSLPLVWWTARLVLDGWVPQGDDAVLAVKTHDVFSTHPPLLGMRSTSSLLDPQTYAHHPGPLQFYLLAPAYALSGWQPWGLLLGVLLLNVALIGVVLHSAWAAGRLSGLAVAAVLVVTTERYFGDLLVHPWNLWAPILGTLAALMLAWRLLLGQLAALPVYVVVASYAAQAHIVGLPVMGLLTAVLAVVGLVRWRRARGSVWPVPGYHRAPTRPVWKRPGWVAAGLTVVCWLPPLVDTLTYRPSNLSQLATLREPPATGTVGWGLALDNLARMAVPGRQGLPVSASPLQLALTVTALVGCALCLRHLPRLVRRPRRERDALTAAALVALVPAVAVLLLGARSYAPLQLMYLDIYLPAALMAVAVAGWAGIRLLGNRTRHAGRVAVAAVVLGLVAAALIPTSLFERGPSGEDNRDVVAGRTAVQQVRAVLADHPADRAVVVRGIGTTAFGGLAPAVTADLVAGNRAVYFDTWWPNPEDDQARRTRNAPPDAVHVVLSEDPTIAVAPGTRETSFVVSRSHGPPVRVYLFVTR